MSEMQSEPAADPRHVVTGRKGPAKTAGANIRDIAAAAGVSVATVSRVMRGNVKVSDATKAKVEQAVNALGYVPNAHARALTTPPNSVTLVLRSIRGGTYGDMVGELAHEVVRRGMACRLIATGGSAQVDAHAVLTDLLAQRPRVAIVMADDDPGAITDDELNGYADRFESMGTTLVALARPRCALSERIRVVDYENEPGMYKMTRYLLSMGHRDMLYVGKRAHSEIFAARYRGFLRALREAGIRHDEASDLVYDPVRYSDTARIVSRYRDGSPFTAVVGATDMLALDAINALRSLDVSVPQQISVAGFDDMPLSDELVVPLTTVHISFAEMGVAAVRLGLDGGGDIMMPSELVIRESAMPASDRR
ncbi:LacI family transcriptional regulator [Bifidobacterium amazonense]|uniref:LacI family transcriptional regulator n=1 Tax=Bifidobacterium amazonense TaxID=2809027 RepID=A0ABS9VXP0_9BIFI|nr:LacI family DNA-binding transcriptional regulator [Bifidobacterium amazonense]MCH9276863.1 LacI family transcriptional regulator [Bifidobacterium amazonense]